MQCSRHRNVETSDPRAAACNLGFVLVQCLLGAT